MDVGQGRNKMKKDISLNILQRTNKEARSLFKDMMTLMDKEPSIESESPHLILKHIKTILANL